MQHPDFKTLVKQARQEREGKPSLRLAIVSEATTKYLKTAIQGYGNLLGWDFEIWEGGYELLELQTADHAEIWAFKPDLILLLNDVQKIKNAFGVYPEKKQFANDFLGRMQGIQQQVAKQSKARLVVTNLPLIPDSVHRHFNNNRIDSFLFQLRKINLGLAEWVQGTPGSFIFDQAMLDLPSLPDSKYYYLGDMLVDMSLAPALAYHLIHFLTALLGKVQKCLILDLDNTLWGGIVGDDGIDGIIIGRSGKGKVYQDLQTWVLALKNRGILLAICSKNEEGIAKKAFQEREEMVLNLEDFVAFKANWKSKPENILSIQKELNIGLNSFVFLDDNPLERAFVKEALPNVCVPDLPDDSVYYLSYLQKLALFETGSLSEEDVFRTKRYQEEGKRKSLAKETIDTDAFLASLEMELEVGLFDEANMRRIAQLTQRSNQFNLRTIRYDEAGISDIITDPNRIGLYIKLKDKFGPYGLISVAILERKGSAFFIDTWVMSCRVMGRKVENEMLTQLKKHAKEAGAEKLIGIYLPTERNKPVSRLLPNIGFKQQEDFWEMDLS